jgi:3-deoxy-7-phosphoheptulonate synthase
MIIVLKPEASEREVDHIIDRLRELGLKSQLSTGQERTIIGVVGDDRILHNQPLTAMPGVESVLPILAPWKLVSREFKREGTIIDVSGMKIGGNKLIIMAGPARSSGSKSRSALPTRSRRPAQVFCAVAPTSHGPPPIPFRD